MESVTRIYQRKEFNDKIDEARFSSEIISRVISFSNSVLKEFKNFETQGINVNDNY